MQAPTTAGSVDIWMVITAVATAVAGIFAAVAAGISFFQGRAAERNQRAFISFEVSSRYDKAYEHMNALLKNPVKWEEFDKSYPAVKDKLSSPEWARLRNVAGFFEITGVLVDEGLIKPELLFKFMSVRPQLWSDNEETVRKMRECYTPDLWIYWESLVKKREDFKKRLAGK